MDVGLCHLKHGRLIDRKSLEGLSIQLMKSNLEKGSDSIGESDDPSCLPAPRHQSNCQDGC